MTFKIKNFATIRIFTDDVPRARDWYKKFLGISPVEDLENFVSFKINGTCFDISLADSKSPASAGGSVGYWLVDNLANMIERAIELGGQVYRGPLRVEEVKRTIVQIKDPVGNVIGFEEDFSQ